MLKWTKMRPNSKIFNQARICLKVRKKLEAQTHGNYMLSSMYNTMVLATMCCTFNKLWIKSAKKVLYWKLLIYMR